MTIVLTMGILFGNITPPVILHSHIDRHGQQVCATEGDHHSHAHGHSHSHSHDSRERQTLATRDSHLHISIFGIEFSFSADKRTQLPNDESGDHPNEEILIDWMESDLLVSKTTMADSLRYDSLVYFIYESATVTSQLEFDQQRYGDSSSILCDAARCERSGVLLI